MSAIAAGWESSDKRIGRYRNTVSSANLDKIPCFQSIIYKKGILNGKMTAFSFHFKLYLLKCIQSNGFHYDIFTYICLKHWSFSLTSLCHPCSFLLLVSFTPILLWNYIFIIPFSLPLKKALLYVSWSTWIHKTLNLWLTSEWNHRLSHSASGSFL